MRLLNELVQLLDVTCLNKDRIVLYCIVLYCIVLYCIVLYCIVLSVSHKLSQTVLLY